MENNSNVTYWSRCPGKFVNRYTGEEITNCSKQNSPRFETTVREWWNTLTVTIAEVLGTNDFSGYSIYTTSEINAIISHLDGFHLNPLMISIPFPVAGLTGTLNDGDVFVDEPRCNPNKILVEAKDGRVFEIRVLGLSYL